MKADAIKVKTKNGAPAKEADASMSAKVKSEVIAWFWVILAFMLINGTLGQARVIPSGSMENTLLIGDHLIMSRIGYDAGIPFTNVHIPLWRDPKRQQIVIFKPPFDPAQPDYVKRVIGLPGETVDVRDGGVWINGKRLAENYTIGRSEPPGRSQLIAPFTGLPFTVPKDCYFVMGDNRENSLDSRYWGCVPRNDILGTPVLIYMSLDAPRDAWNGDIGARFLAYGNAIIHPGTIRWRRLFHVF
ncbi:MAG TPA: signal peptidase I [Candidatus Limnocylindrales bacterium]|nr:signal peptidase I [Candidatus Limnocylindrales bacterium]